ncbi:hypothetical protein E4U21_000252 [Claviceps maximensis]|nr:hypothetical protein E4U21_000252 [Claviceps maximensis]
MTTRCLSKPVPVHSSLDTSATSDAAVLGQTSSTSARNGERALLLLVTGHKRLPLHFSHRSYSLPVAADATSLAVGCEDPSACTLILSLLSFSLGSALQEHDGTR